MANKGGVMKHRKILRDNIQGITKPALQRMVLKAGIPECSGLCYEELRGVLKVHLEKTVRDSVTYTEHDRAKRVQVRHVQKALEGLGRESYARLCGQRTTQLNPTVGAGNVMKRSTVKDCKRKSPAVCSADVHHNSSAVGRWHKGTSSLAAMRKTQKQTTCHNFSKVPFERLIREVAQDFKTDLQFAPEAVDMIQSDAEAYLLDLLQSAAYIVIAAKRRRLQPKDIQTARRIRNERG